MAGHFAIARRSTAIVFHGVFHARTPWCGHLRVRAAPVCHCSHQKLKRRTNGLPREMSARFEPEFMGKAIYQFTDELHLEIGRKNAPERTPGHLPAFCDPLTGCLLAVHGIFYQAGYGGQNAPANQPGHALPGQRTQIKTARSGGARRVCCSGGQLCSRT